MIRLARVRVTRLPLLAHGQVLATTGNEKEQPGSETNESDALAEHDRPYAHFSTDEAAGFPAAALSLHSTLFATGSNSSAFTGQYRSVQWVSRRWRHGRHQDEVGNGRRTLPQLEHHYPPA